MRPGSFSQRMSSLMLFGGRSARPASDVPAVLTSVLVVEAVVKAFELSATMPGLLNVVLAVPVPEANCEIVMLVGLLMAVM